MEHIVRLLEDPLIAPRLIFDYVESDVISHPCNSASWKEYQDYKDQVDIANNCVHRLLMLRFFIDEYKQHRHRNNKVLGIYFSLANLPADLLQDSAFMYLLCLVPTKADMDNALEQVIVRRARQLERGVRVQVNGTDMPVVGSVDIICGDHPGQAEVSGLIGPRAFHPSRYSLAGKDELNITRFDDIPLPTRRQSLPTYNLLCDLLSGPVTTARDTLRQYGLKVTLSQSPQETY